MSLACIRVDGEGKYISASAYISIDGSNYESLKDGELIPIDPGEHSIVISNKSELDHKQAGFQRATNDGSTFGNIMEKLSSAGFKHFTIDVEIPDGCCLDLVIHDGKLSRAPSYSVYEMSEDQLNILANQIITVSDKAKKGKKVGWMITLISLAVSMGSIYLGQESGLELPEFISTALAGLGTIGSLALMIGIIVLIVNYRRARRLR